MEKDINKKDTFLVEQVIYLTNYLFGVYFGGFKFSWNNNSPYSPALASLIEDYSDRDDIKEEMFQLKEHVYPYIEQLKKVFFTDKPEEYSNEEWIKLIAYVIFQWDIARWNHYSQWAKIKNQGIEKSMHFIGDKLFILENCPYKRKEITKCTKILLEHKLISLK